MARRTISKIARDAGVGVETIRFYERTGVLTKPLRPEQGWRHYSDSAVWAVRYVKKAQSMGLTLAECKRLLRSKARPPQFCRNVRALVGAKLPEIDAEIRRLKALRDEIESFLARCAQRQATGTCPIYEHVASELKERRLEQRSSMNSR